MKSNWQAAMAVELRFEGGKVDDPRDPGGRTNEGVIQRVFSAYLQKKGQPVRDVYTMTPAERDEIYMQQYGWKIAFDQLPPGLDLVILDGAINSGVTQSVKWVQRCLGLTADGQMGDVTLQAVQNYPDHDALIAAICERRMAFLRALKPWPVYKKGWTSRVNQVKAKGQAWAMGSVGPAVTYAPGGEKKATLTQAVPPPPRAVGDVIGTGGTISSGLSTVQGYLEPLQGNPYIDKVILGIVIGGAILGIAGFAWSYYARTKKAELEDVLDLVPHSAPNNNDATPMEILMKSDAPLAYQGAPELSKGV
jgi:lysozyme family protein